MAYHIDYSVALGRRAQKLHLEAIARGQGNAFYDGLADLHARLEADPYIVGEIKYNTPMGFPVYSAASGAASIYYVIYEARKVVCLTKLERLGS